MHCPYKVITWDNAGQRREHPFATLAEALDVAKEQRMRRNRTVKVGHCGDAIRHWTRTEGRHGNQWSSRATAECSR